MTKQTFAVAGGIAALLAIVGCSPSVAFDVEYEASTVIQSGGLLGNLAGDLGFGQLFTVDIADSQQFQNNNARKDKIEEARLTKLSLTALDGDNNLDFLNRVSFYVSSPGLDRVRIATKAIPDGNTTVNLDLDDVDLGPYLRSDQFGFSTEVEGTRPNKDTTVQAKLTIHLVVRLTS